MKKAKVTTGKRPQLAKEAPVTAPKATKERKKKNA